MHTSCKHIGCTKIIDDIQSCGKTTHQLERIIKGHVVGNVDDAAEKKVHTSYDQKYAENDQQQ